MAVKIVHLYPKELNTYSDIGNVICLCNRLSCRGYDYELVDVGVGDNIPNFDIMLIGGGQDKDMRLLSPDIRRKSDSLSYYINSNKVIFAVCGGYQLLGEYYRIGSDTIRLSGALPFYTVAGQYRMIGNFAFNTDFGAIVGFENHSGRTFLCGGLDCLGTLDFGYGNNGYDYTEGVLFKNTFGTYAHGPVLPKNPALADELIRRAIGDIEPLDDTLENACHDYIYKKFS